MDLPKHIVICDIEGTIADHRHRIHLARDGCWNEFFSRLNHDKFRIDVWERVRSFNLPVVFVTGIPENFRESLESWLEQNNVLYAGLYMKAEGDYRPSEITKEEIYDKYFTQVKIEAVFEDLPEVINMWQRKGLKVFDVSIKEQ